MSNGTIHSAAEITARDGQRRTAKAPEKIRVSGPRRGRARKTVKPAPLLHGAKILLTRPELLAYWNKGGAIMEAYRVAELEKYWRENAPGGEPFDVDKARKLRLRNEDRT